MLSTEIQLKYKDTKYGKIYTMLTLLKRNLGSVIVSYKIDFRAKDRPGIKKKKRKRKSIY